LQFGLISECLTKRDWLLAMLATETATWPGLTPGGFCQAL
jgi:hypothetical protein